jgi:hypothetical protein
VSHYADVSNNIATKSLNWKTPTEAHFGIKPSIAHFRRFGCPVFLHKNKEARDSPAAFTSRVQRGIHLGNAADSKLGVYLIFNLQTKSLCKSQSLYFDEEFQMVTKSPTGWKFQLSRLDSEYSTLLFRQTDVPLPREAVEFRVGSSGLTTTVPPFISDEHTFAFSSDTLPLPPIQQSPLNAPVPLLPQSPLNAPVPIIQPSSPVPIIPPASPVVEPASRQPRTVNEVNSENIITGGRRRQSIQRLNVNPSAGGARAWQDNAASAAAPVDFTFSAMETLASLVLDDHLSDAIPFQSASATTLAIASSSFDNLMEMAEMPINYLSSAPQQYLTRGLLGFSLSAASLIAATTLPSAPPPPLKERPPPLKEKPVVDFLQTSRQIQKFIMEHGDDGRTAFDDEMTGMINAGVLSVPVPLPQGQRAPPATMLCSQKADGRLKCRLVYRGDLQVEGLNYDGNELYAPVMDKTSFRLLLAIGAAHHAHIHTLDINLAFLYGEMHDELYMSPPKGIKLAFGLVYRVLKSIYGTKQAPAIWHKVLKDWLHGLGFEPLIADPCVFTKTDEDGFFFIGVHVDDLLMVTTSETMLNNFKTATTQRFSFKDQGELNNREFTGCFVSYDRIAGSVSLSCDRSVLKLLQLANYEGCNPHHTPIAKQSIRDTTPDTSPIAKIFGAISGHANWLSVLCRPDLALASSMLATYNWLLPTVSDVKDAIRLLRYLKGSLHAYPRMGVTFTAASFRSLKAALTPVSFADSDHAGDPAGGPTTKRSRSGLCIWFCGGLIYWRSALQKTVATSTTYSEIIALSDLCKQLVWVLALLKQLSFPQCTVPVYEDNQPALDSILAHRNSQRTRHYEIRYFWVRELTDERKIIDLIKVGTTLNYADFWTKILPKAEMIEAIQSLMFKPLHNQFHPKN